MGKDVQNKPNIFLDLDNTIISAEAIEDFPFTKKDILHKVCKFTFYNMDGYYLVFERPHLQQFLDYLFENFNVSVWTAASKDYALFIVDKIILKKKNRKLNYVFWNYHGKISKKKYKTISNGDPKNLKLLWEHFKLEGINADNTIIIDDFSDVTDVQTENSIRIKEFNILDENSENDNELLGNIIPEIEQKFK